MESNLPTEREFFRKNTKVSRSLKVAIFLIAFCAIDFGFRTHEANQLVSNIEASEKVMGDHNLSLKKISDATYSRESKIKNVAIISESNASKIFVTGVQVERMTILPWHKKLRIARSDYMQHSNAWYEYTSKTKIIYDPIRLEFGSNENISPTFDLLKVTLPQSIPNPDFLNLRSRVNKILF